VVGRLYRAERCMNYKKGVLTEYPVLKLRLYNVLGMEFPEEIEAPVDTGYEGSLMLNSEDYEFFSIGELPRDYWRTYSTLAGSVVMRVARAIATIDKKKLEVYVETPYFGGGKRLIGREVLNKLRLILDGPNTQCCIAKPT